MVGESESSNAGGHAVVVGGSMAGLFNARVVAARMNGYLYLHECQVQMKRGHKRGKRCATLMRSVEAKPPLEQGAKQ